MTVLTFSLRWWVAQELQWEHSGVGLQVGWQHWDCDCVPSRLPSFLSYFENSCLWSVQLQIIVLVINVVAIKLFNICSIAFLLVWWKGSLARLPSLHSQHFFHIQELMFHSLYWLFSITGDCLLQLQSHHLIVVLEPLYCSLGLRLFSVSFQSAEILGSYSPFAPRTKTFQTDFSGKACPGFLSPVLPDSLKNSLSPSLSTKGFPTIFILLLHSISMPLPVP